MGEDRARQPYCRTLSGHECLFPQEGHGVHLFRFFVFGSVSFAFFFEFFFFLRSLFGKMFSGANFCFGCGCWSCVLRSFLLLPFFLLLWGPAQVPLPLFLLMVGRTSSGFDRSGAARCSLSLSLSLSLPFFSSALSARVSARSLALSLSLSISLSLGALSLSLYIFPFFFSHAFSLVCLGLLSWVRSTREAYL